MRFTFDEETGACYLYVVERIAAGSVAKTVQVVDAQVMLDLDKSGALLGIEILNPTLLGTAPEILKARQIQPPESIQFNLLAKALTPPPATVAATVAATPTSGSGRIK